MLKVCVEQRRPALVVLTVHGVASRQQLPDTPHAPGQSRQVKRGGACRVLEQQVGGACSRTQGGASSLLTHTRPHPLATNPAVDVCTVVKEKGDSWSISTAGCQHEGGVACREGGVSIADYSSQM